MGAGSLRATRGTGATPAFAAAGGLPAAFTDAFDTLYRRAYRTAFKLLGDRLEAEDIAKEACARVCMRWRRVDDPVAWVSRVSANLSFDRWRRLRTAARHAAPPPDAIWATADGVPGGAPLKPPYDGPIDNTSFRQTVDNYIFDFTVSSSPR